jgi:hypothetical protein
MLSALPTAKKMKNTALDQKMIGAVKQLVGPASHQRLPMRMVS